MGLVGQNHTMKKFKQGEAWKEPQLQETKCVCSISRTMNIEKGDGKKCPSSESGLESEHWNL